MLVHPSVVNKWWRTFAYGVDVKRALLSVPHMEVYPEGGRESSVKSLFSPHNDVIVDVGVRNIEDI